MNKNKRYLLFKYLELKLKTLEYTFPLYIFIILLSLHWQHYDFFIIFLIALIVSGVFESNIITKLEKRLKLK